MESETEKRRLTFRLTRLTRLARFARVRLLGDDKPI